MALPLVIRNRANRASWVFISVTVTACFHAVDIPLFWAGPDTFEDPWEVRALNFQVAVVCALIVIGSCRYFWHPRVEVGDDEIVIFNPLRTYRIARGGVVGVDLANRRYPLVTLVDGTRIRTVGAEQSLRMNMFKPRHRITLSMRSLRRQDDDAPLDGKPLLLRYWQPPSTFEWLLISYWSVMVVVVAYRWMTEWDPTACVVCFR